MTLFPKGSIDGRYEYSFVPPAETPVDAAVIVNAFGFRLDDHEAKIPGPLNEALANYTDKNFVGHPILASADVAPALEAKPALILDVESSSGSLDTLRDPRTTGTAGELSRAKEFMVREGYATAIIVAHAFHVARVTRMAEKLQIQTEVPEGMPTDFDPLNEQPWIRDEVAWKKRERLTIGYMILRRMM